MCVVTRRVLELLSEREIDPHEFSDRLGVSGGYLARLLGYERPWPVALIFRVAEIFEISPAELEPSIQTIQ